jgi:hypothetical protein
MKNPIRTALVVIGTSLLIGAASSSSAATSIGASFVGRNATPADVLAPTDSAGVVAQSNWYNVFDDGSTFDGTTAGLMDSAGAFTSVKIIYDASDSWSSDGPTVTPDDKLMKGIIKANPDPDTVPINNTDTMKFVITNLPPSGTFNVIVYAMENEAGAEADISIGSTTYYLEQQNNFDGNFTQATSTTAGSYADANYAEFDGVAPAADGTITITAKKNIVDPQVNDGIGVAGIQIVQVSGPAYPPNADPATITQQPVSTSAVEGESASFTVGASGPYTLQWLKNGAAIPGATESYLTGATKATYRVASVTAADDGAKFSALVYNNVITNKSAEATLSLDTNPPVLIGATAFPGTTKIGLRFNKSLDAPSATTGSNYKVNGAAITSAVVRTNVANELTNEKNLVQLTVPTALAANFTVTVSGVKDQQGHAMAETTVSGKILDLTSTDIGSPDGQPGGPDPQGPTTVTTWGPGAFDVLTTGSNDYWNNADGFNFLWAPKTNSFDVKVRVVSVSPINNWSAGAIEVREGPPTPTGGGWELSRHYFSKVDYGGPDPVAVLDGSGDGADSYEFNGRLAPGDPTLRETSNSAPGGSVGWGGSGPGNPSPVPFPNAWIRIARVKEGTSDHLLGYSSSDGVEWSLRQDVDLNDDTHAGFLDLNGAPAGKWPDVCYVGLGSTSHTGIGNNNAMNEGNVGEFWYSPIGQPYSCFVIYRDYGDFATATPGPTLTFQVAADGTVTLTYTGTLVSSDTVNGTYQPVTGATSPFVVNPSTTAKPATFYQAKQ